MQLLEIDNLSKSNELANSFAKSKKNIYSQCGEDGIIEKILNCLPTDNWCVEFGAWDGIYLSNTFNLIKNKNYKAVLIEADSNKFLELEKNLQDFDAVLINEFVTFSGKNTLDNLLSKTSIPQNFDFLSIDIDGNDYYILESLIKFRPKVICIEFNPTIPNDINFIQPKSFEVKQGSSARAIYTLAKSKGYLLAAATRCNLIFVDRVYSTTLQLEDMDLSVFRDDLEERVYVFSGYDGTVFLSKPLKLICHDVDIREPELQALPKVIRKFRSDYNFMERCIYGAYILMKRPAEFGRRIRRKFK